MFYVPVTAWAACLAVRYGHPLAFTAVNPGIPNGGGTIGESKDTVLRALASSPHALAHVLVPGGGSVPERVALARGWIEARPEPQRWPVVLKPDVGERGYGVRVARSARDLEPYFRACPSDVLVQAYHPGPHECGVFWIRRRLPGERRGGGDASGGAGFIYAVTRKTFPEVTGDGRRTLGELVLAHGRYRQQAGVFLRRLGVGAARVPGDGERVRLAEAGNHCQGTLFTDGMDLVTPALEEAIDRVARGFGGSGDGADTGLFDLGRFDLRAESDDALRAGRFGIIELNGALSEPTSLYDPGRSVGSAYRLLLGQWSHMYRLGAARRRRGHATMPLRAILAELRRGRPGHDPALVIAD